MLQLINMYVWNRLVSYKCPINTKLHSEFALNPNQFNSMVALLYQDLKQCKFKLWVFTILLNVGNLFFSLGKVLIFINEENYIFQMPMAYIVLWARSLCCWVFKKGKYTPRRETLLCTVIFIMKYVLTLRIEYQKIILMYRIAWKNNYIILYKDKRYITKNYVSTYHWAWLFWYFYKRWMIVLMEGSISLLQYAPCSYMPVGCFLGE